MSGIEGSHFLHPLYIIAAGRHRDLGIEDRLDELQGKIRELEKQNTTLKSKVRIQHTCMYIVQCHTDVVHP